LKNLFKGGLIMDWKQDLELLWELLMLEFEADRKKLHEMLDGRSIREF
jgi:hypothetical protein